jgi:general nucleoside transport system permease protein
MLLEAVLTGAVRGGTSILYPALGETIAERSGVVNLGTEGCMLAGAFTAYAVGIETGNPWLGVLAGALSGAALATVFALVVLGRGANQIATGLVVTFLGIGLTSLFGQDYVGQGVQPLERMPVPGLADAPFIGPILFDHDLLTYASVLGAVAVWLVMFRTRRGLWLRAAGERPEVLATLGTSPTRVRAVAILCSGALSGVGGAQLATAYTRNWSENMTVGRGFVAVALVIFAAWSPLKAIAGAYLFSGAIALQLELQARGSGLSPYLLQSLPYVVVIVVLAAASRRRITTVPEALTKVFQGAS